jgi:hypothetical protein
MPHNEHDDLQLALAHATDEERELIAQRFQDARSADAEKVRAMRDAADLRDLVVRRSKKSLGRTAGLPLVLDGEEVAAARLSLTVQHSRVELVLIEDSLTDARAKYTEMEMRSERVITADPDLVSLTFDIEQNGIARTPRVSVARLMEATVRAVVAGLPRVSIRT